MTIGVVNLRQALLVPTEEPNLVDQTPEEYSSLCEVISPKHINNLLETQHDTILFQVDTIEIEVIPVATIGIISRIKLVNHHPLH